jgi:alpha-ketoglutarate-dependent 2,4-dichlorophenoxyacetate dioxygenase
LAHEIPPVGTGGNTEFADTRTAFDELPEPLKKELLANDYVGAHSLFHSRKLGSPEFFAGINPLDYKTARHHILQRHEPSTRINLYIAAHCHHIDGVSAEKSAQLLRELIEHSTQAKFIISIPWHGPGDMIIWDNTCVMHKASGGSFEGRFRRDMRRTTVHDGSSQAWGLNDPSEVKQGFEVST